MSNSIVLEVDGKPMGQEVEVERDRTNSAISR